MKIRIEKPLLKSLTLMASVIEARDAYTGGHLWRVSRYAGCLAQSCGLSPDMIFLASLGGFLHDIGKVGIPDHILGKRGKLSLPEYEVIKTHPGIGAALIQEHPLGGLALSSVHQHHEWVDGTGYPNHLQADAISIYARIVSIADAFDALTSARPYRREVTSGKAFAALEAEHGSQFDGELLENFGRLIAANAFTAVAGYCEADLPMVHCLNCGPVISVTKDTRDGDIAVCRACGGKNRLHRKGDTFVVEQLDEMSTAEDLVPRPERASIEAFIARAPAAVEIP